MNYCSTFEAAGAKVLASYEDDDYQGTGIAHVEVNGVRGYIRYGFGSCSHCDSFESFYYEGHSDGPSPEQMADFGREYVEGMVSYEKARAEVLGGYGYIEEQLAFLERCENG